MDKKYTEAGALLRGTRHLERLSQKEFAKRIEVTQSDLSKMENVQLVKWLQSELKRNLAWITDIFSVKKVQS